MGLIARPQLLSDWPFAAVPGTKISLRFLPSNNLVVQDTSGAELTFATHLWRTQRANVNSKSNTKISLLLVFLMVQTFALGRAEKGGKCLNRNTSAFTPNNTMNIAKLIRGTKLKGP